MSASPGSVTQNVRDRLAYWANFGVLSWNEEQSDPTGLKRGQVYRIRPNIGDQFVVLTLDTREAELFLYGMALAGHTYASQTPVPDTAPLLGKEGP
jgi:hypothetical protein